MTPRLLALAVLLAQTVIAHPTRADVLCRKPSGAIVVRDACRRRESPLDLTSFVGVGPQGPQGSRGAPGIGPRTECPPDSVLVGPSCVDKYEASVWQIDPANTALIEKVHAGTVTLADLGNGGATQLCGGPNHDQVPSNFPKSGQWTAIPGTNPPSAGVYAVSVAGAMPTTCTSWFQAAQACRLAGKRLLTNLEWQDAAAGTPDPGTDDGATDCAVASPLWALVPTGSRAGCVSAWGTFDMVGNADEWVADWADQANACTDWTAMNLLPGTDSLCFGGSGNLSDGSTFSRAIPGALLRGGAFLAPGPAYGHNAGVFAVTSHTILTESGAGFRCGR